MACLRIIEVAHFQGVSSDVKPEGAVNGSTFHIVDTGEKYICHDGQWVEDLSLIYALTQASK